MRGPSILISMAGALAASALYLGCASLAGLDESFEPRPDAASSGGGVGGATSSSGASSSMATGGAAAGGGGSNDPCANGHLDPGETDVDCGGPSCSPCGPGGKCGGVSDCSTNYCGADKVCHGFLAVTAGALHTCVLTDVFEVFCWGDNGHDQLGYVGPGTSTPQRVGTPVDTEAISAGDAFTCVQPKTGKIVCWGQNDHDELGLTTMGDYAGLQMIDSSDDLYPESAGSGHVCVATHHAGGASCWGRNDKRQLNDGDNLDATSPQPVHNLNGLVKGIASGTFHTCVISGNVPQCWGNDASGQRSTPAELGQLTGVSAITAGALHTCALVGETVSCWGSNQFHQLSGGSTGGDAPVQVEHLSATAIGAGAGHTCAITTGGAVACWGDNGLGELGEDTSITGRADPTKITGLEHAAQLAAGAHHTCAIRGDDGSLVCWGDNSAGQIGVASPAVVQPFAPVIF